jgi:hypothetical protein
MTDQLDNKIRSLMVQVAEASTAAPEFEDIMELRLSTESDPAVVPLLHLTEQPRRRWPVAVASAAAVFVLVGGVGLLFNLTESESPATATLAEPVPNAVWSRIPADESIFGGRGTQWMESVTAGGPGLVAVGRDGPNAAVWTSADGTTWDRVPHDEAVFAGSGPTAMMSVTVGGPGFVAVGYDGLIPYHSHTAVWTSVDGLAWSRIPLDESIFSGWMKGVTAGGPGLVAVGADRGAVAVWTSVDGLTWSPVAQDNDIFGSPGGQSHGMTSVTAGGPGLVAVGENVEGVGGVGVWTSVDGIAWSRVPDETLTSTFSPEGFMWSVTTGGPGLVAVGFDGPNAAVWTSEDGIAWSQIHDEAVFGGPEDLFMSMNSVTNSADGLVAVGVGGHSRPLSGPLSGPGGSKRQQPGYGTLFSANAAVWTSQDGITWSRTPHDDTVFGEADRRWTGITGVTRFGTGVIAVGADKTTAGVDAAVWTATTKD